MVRMLKVAGGLLFSRSFSRAFRGFPPRLHRGRPANGRASSLRKPLRPPHLFLLLSIILTGCMLIGPDFKRPPAPLASKWNDSNDADVNNGIIKDRDWWTIFNDADLNRLVGVAYQNNLSLREAGVRVLEARAQLGIAIGEF